MGSASNLGVSLMPARAIQAVTGAASIWAIARAVDLGGLGEVLTAVAAVGIVSGIVGAALSDYALAIPNGLSIRLPRWISSLAWASAGSAVPALLLGLPAPLIVALFVTSSLLAALEGALRLAHARAEARTRRIGWSWSLSSILSLVAHATLSFSLVGAWEAYLVAYIPTMLALLSLPKLPRKVDNGEPARVSPWISLRGLSAYAVAQGSWLIMGQAPIVIGRVLLDAEAAAVLGVAMRIADSVGVLLPIMGLMALPIFARIFASDAPTSEQWRVNRSIAAVGSVWIAGVGPAGWLLWRLLVPTSPFPTITYALLLAASVFGATFGVPDRILQAAGRAAEVGRWGLLAAIGTVVWCIGFTTLLGLEGAASASLTGALIANVALMFRASNSFKRTAWYSGTAIGVSLLTSSAVALLVGRFWGSLLWSLAAGAVFTWSILRSGLDTALG
jgi:O-antigen/teichoic acid export membrane protein